jgi:hypothetical protein
MGMIDIPLLATHLGRDGRVLAQARTLAEAATPQARAAFEHLDGFTQFVHGRAPSALDQVRDGLRLVVDEQLVDDAIGGDGAVQLGRAGVKFLGDPIEHPVVVGHELTHALALPDGNYMMDELGADLVGLAYARSIARAPAGGDDAWRIAMVDRDLRHPLLPTMDALRAYQALDTHVMAGPIGAALARASDEIGVGAMDAITTDAVLRELPRTSPKLAQQLDDLIWSGRDADVIGRAVADASMDDAARALLTSATARHGRSSDEVAALLRELRASGLELG